MNKDLTNFNKFRFNNKVFSTNKFTEQKGEFIVGDSFEINLYDSRIKSIEFCWVDGMWEITDISYFQYQVDPKSPKKAGLITLADEKDVTKDVMDNNDSAITPILLEKRQSTEKRKGIAKLATQTEVNKGESTNSIVTPKTLKTILDERITTDHDTKTTYHDIDESTMGYHFKFISSSDDIKKYNIPMTNFKQIDLVNGVYVYKTDKAPIYGEYLYESFKSPNKHIEKIYCDNKEWVRETTNGKTIGWVINYTFHNKPKPKDIGALDANNPEIENIQIIGKLDIIVDKDNRLRIQPDKEPQKVSFLWLEGNND